MCGLGSSRRARRDSRATKTAVASSRDSACGPRPPTPSGCFRWPPWGQRQDAGSAGRKGATGVGASPSCTSQKLGRATPSCRPQLATDTEVCGLAPEPQPAPVEPVICFHEAASTWLANTRAVTAATTWAEKEELVMQNLQKSCSSTSGERLVDTWTDLRSKRRAHNGAQRTSFQSWGDFPAAGVALHPRPRPARL